MHIECVYMHGLFGYALQCVCAHAGVRLYVRVCVCAYILGLNLFTQRVCLCKHVMCRIHMCAVLRSCV